MGYITGKVTVTGRKQCYWPGGRVKVSTKLSSFQVSYFSHILVPPHKRLFFQTRSIKQMTVALPLIKIKYFTMIWNRFLPIWVELSMAESAKAAVSQAHSVWVLVIRIGFRLSWIQVYGISLLKYHCRVKWFLIVNDLSCCDFHFIYMGLNILSVLCLSTYLSLSLSLSIYPSFSLSLAVTVEWAKALLYSVKVGIAITRRLEVRGTATTLPLSHGNQY